MAFDPSRLLSLLLNTGLAIKDNSLYQVINEIIRALGTINSNVGGINTTVNNITTGGAGGNTTASYLTENNEVTGLPNSRRLVAGNRITFDTSVAGQLIISATAITVFQQPTEPMSAQPGDIWIS